jgi:8-amino-7-oxononanoate synthase
MSGHLELHEELESDLAEMTGAEAALVFGSGYLTNIGVLSSLAGAGDHIFADSLNHASLIDGARLSRAGISPYRHADLDHLEQLLKATDTSGQRLIVSESVFSMDGDLAPLQGLADLAARYQALLIIDEAHAIGIMGQRGGGLCRVEGGEVTPDVVIGTLSKALGGYGGFVASSRTIRRFLINKARTFIYSTGLHPACLAGGREAVSIVAENPDLGNALLEKTGKFRQSLSRAGLNSPENQSPILPIIVGDNEKTLRFSQLLQEQGLLIRAIRPPTVPSGSSRVRLSLTLALSDDSLKEAAEKIVQTAEKTGLIQ